MQAGDSILGYDDGDLILLWINGLAAGDRFHIYEEGLGTRTMFVDSTEDTTVNGIETTKTWIHGGLEQIWGWDTTYINLAGSAMIYDVFGPENGFHYFTCWGFYDCGPPSLCRYKSNETGVVDLNTGYHCETLVTKTDDKDLRQFSIYPNPCSDYIIVEQPGEYSDSRLEIFSQSGTLVLSVPMTSEKNVVDISNVPRGIFFCRLNGKNGVRVEKLVKE
jgi:hypothetical protein